MITVTTNDIKIRKDAHGIRHIFVNFQTADGAFSKGRIGEVFTNGRTPDGKIRFSAALVDGTEVDGVFPTATFAARAALKQARALFHTNTTVTIPIAIFEDGHDGGTRTITEVK